MITLRLLPATLVFFLHLTACDSNKNIHAKKSTHSPEVLVAGLLSERLPTQDKQNAVTDIQINNNDTPVINIHPSVHLILYQNKLDEATQANFSYRGDSNLLAIDDKKNVFLPIQNIEPLRINYMVLSPDKESLYFHLSANKEHSAKSTYLSDHISLNDSTELTWQTPLVGRTFEMNFPLTLNELKKRFGKEAYFTYDYYVATDDHCTQGGYLTYLPDTTDMQVCINTISIGGTTHETPHIPATSLANGIQRLFKKHLFFCSILAYHRSTQALSCLTGNRQVDASATIAGINIPIKVTIPWIEPETRNTLPFDNIKKGLRPLQFDAFSNRYISTHNFIGHYSQLNKIDQHGNISIITPSENDTFDSYVIFPSGNFAYSSRATLQSKKISKSLKLYKDGKLLSVPASSQYADNYQVDESSTLFVDGHLLNAFGAGIAQTPLTWDGYKVSRLFSTKNHVLGCVGNLLVQVVPFKQEPLLNGNCDFDAINDTHAFKINHKKGGQYLQLFPLNGTKPFDLQMPNLSQIDLFRPTSQKGWVAGTDLQNDTAFLASFNTDTPSLSNLDTILLPPFVASDNHAIDMLSLHPLISPTQIASTTDITRWLINPYQHNQISIKFPHPIDQRSVMQALTFKQKNKTISFLPFWHQSQLSMFPTLTTTEALNKKIGRVAPTWFSTNNNYQIKINPETIKSLAGLQLESGNLEHSFHFKPVNAFSRHLSSTSFNSNGLQNHTAQLKAAPFAQREKRSSLSSYNFNYWGAYGDKGSDRVFRYFKFTTSTLRNTTYRLTFDLLNRDSKHRWGIGLSKIKAALFANDDEIETNQVWQWRYTEDQNPLDSNMSSVHAPVLGFSLHKKTAYQYPSNRAQFNPLLDNSTQNKQFHWQRFQLIITPQAINLAIQNPQGNFEILGEQIRPEIDEDNALNFWLALPHFADVEIDNLTYSAIIMNKEGKWIEDERILSNNFEDSINAFKGIEGLQRTAAEDITPLDFHSP